MSSVLNHDLCTQGGKRVAMKPDWVMWAPNAVNRSFPFKLMVFKYLLSIHSEEVQCQLDEDTGALYCAKQFSFRLRTNSQKAVWLVIHHWSCREPLGNLTPPSISMKHSFYHREFSLRGVWWVEFLPSGHISNTARPPLCPALLCKEEAWLGASGLCKWSLWDLIGSCLIKKKNHVYYQRKILPTFHFWSFLLLVKQCSFGGRKAQRWELACPALPAWWESDSLHSLHPVSSTPNSEWWDSHQTEFKASRKHHETTYLSKRLIRNSCF